MTAPGWGIGDAGHVALSAPATDTHPEEQRKTKLRDDAYRRMGGAGEQRLQRG
jgi:hypothetical protein